MSKQPQNYHKKQPFKEPNNDYVTIYIDNNTTDKMSDISDDTIPYMIEETNDQSNIDDTLNLDCQENDMFTTNSGRIIRLPEHLKDFDL